MPRAPQRSRGTGPRTTGKKRAPSRGTGPRPTEKRSVNRRARACPSPCNVREGNPLGCAYGNLRGPPRYGKTPVLKTRAAHPCLQCPLQLLDGGIPERFIAAVEFILAQHLPRVFFAGGWKRPAFFHSARADIIGTECQLPISIVFV